MLTEMKQSGKFTASVTWSLIVIGFINTLGCVISGFTSQWFGQKKTLIIGLVIILLSHASIVLLFYYEMSYGIIIMICVYLLSF